jgi:hypothetical protein
VISGVVTLFVNAQQAQAELVKKLQSALDEVKVVNGLFPIYMLGWPQKMLRDLLPDRVLLARPDLCVAALDEPFSLSATCVR